MPTFFVWLLCLTTSGSKWKFMFDVWVWIQHKPCPLNPFSINIYIIWTTPKTHILQMHLHKCTFFVFLHKNLSTYTNHVVFTQILAKVQTHWQSVTNLKLHIHKYWYENIHEIQLGTTKLETCYEICDFCSSRMHCTKYMWQLSA